MTDPGTGQVWPTHNRITLKNHHINPSIPGLQIPASDYYVKSARIRKCAPAVFATNRRQTPEKVRDYGLTL